MNFGLDFDSTHDVNLGFQGLGVLVICIALPLLLHIFMYEFQEELESSFPFFFLNNPVK